MGTVESLFGLVRWWFWRFWVVSGLARIFLPK
jgi:hypothetical protein